MHSSTLPRRSIWFCEVGPELYLATIFGRSLAQSSRNGIGISVCGLCCRVAMDTPGPDFPVHRPVSDADGIQLAISSWCVHILSHVFPRHYVGIGPLSRPVLVPRIDLFRCRTVERTLRTGSHCSRRLIPHDRLDLDYFFCAEEPCRSQ